MSSQICLWFSLHVIKMIDHLGHRRKDARLNLRAFINYRGLREPGCVRLSETPPTWVWMSRERATRLQSQNLGGKLWGGGSLPLDMVMMSLSRVRLCATPWTAARQASLSITISWSLLKLMSIESVMPSNHLILCLPLLLLLSIFPSIRVFSNGSALCIRWTKYWSFSFSLSPSNEYSGLISFRIDRFHLLAV